MNFEPSKLQVELAAEITHFASSHLNHNVQERDQAQIFDKELWKKCGQIGLQGLCVPKEYGGRGLDALGTVIGLEALGAACEDGGLCFAIGAHMLAGVVPIWKHGSKEIKSKYFPQLCNGQLIIANGMTEETAGSDVFAMNTVAQRQGDQFLISGNKTYISNGPVSDLFLVYGLTNKEKGFFGGVTAFLLSEKDHEYIKSAPIEKFGLRTCLLGSLEMKNTIVQEKSIVGKEGGGAQLFTESMEWERICMAGLHLGSMKRIISKLLQFVKSRKSGGQSINKYQSIGHKLADMHVELEAAKLLTYQSAWQLDKGKKVNLHASVCKLHVSELFQKITKEAMQIYAGQAYRENHEISRMLRDASGSTIYSGTSEIQRNIIARWMTGVYN